MAPLLKSVLLAVALLWHQAAAQALLKVGGPLQLTGTYMGVGKKAQKAFELWRDTVNSMSLGYSVTLDLRDAPDHNSAVTVAQDMVTNSAVDIMLAPYNSNSSKAVVEALSASSIPIVVWGAADAGIFDQATRAPNVVGLLTPASEFMSSGLEALYAQGARTALLVNAQRGNSGGCYDGAKAKATALGMTVEEELTLMGDGSDAASMLATVSSAGQTADVLVACGNSDSNEALVRGLPASGVMPKAVLATQVATDSFKNSLKASGNASALCGLMMPQQWVNSGTQADPIIGWTPGQFAMAFESAAGSAANDQSAAAGAAGIAISNAVAAAGGISDMAAVTTALKNLDIATFFGQLKFKATGEQMSKTMVTVQNAADGYSKAVAPAAVKHMDPFYPEKCVLKVGGPLQMTGTYATIGMNAHKAITLWKDWVNANKQRLGYSVMLDFRDDTSDNTMAAQIAMDMEAAHAVDVYMPPYTSGASIAVVAALENSSRPVLVWGGASSEIFTQASRAANAFGFFTPAANYMNSGLEDLYAKGARTVTLMKNEDAFSADCLAGAKTKAEALGFTVQGEVMVANTGADAATVLAGLSAAAKAADALVACGHGTDLTEVVKALPSSSTTFKAVLATQVGTGTFKSGLMYMMHVVCGHLMPTQWVKSGTNADPLVGWTADAFSQAFMGVAGSDPTYHSASAAAAVVALSNAIETAGLGDLSALATAMMNLDLQTFYGRIKFDTNGEMMGKDMVTVQNLQDGSTVAVAPSNMMMAAMKYPETCRWKIKVGGPLQLTSSHSHYSFGMGARHSFEMWRDHVNANLDYEVELDFRDTTSADHAAMIAWDMANSMAVDVLVAPYSSGYAARVVEALNASDIPVLVWGGSSSSIFEQGTRAPNVFGLLIPAGNYMESGLELLWDKGARSVLFAKFDTSFGISVCDGARTFATMKGYTIVGEVTIPADAPASNISALQWPQTDTDVLVGCGHEAGIVELIKHYSMGSMSAKAVLATQVANPSFKNTLTDAGMANALCGLLMPTQWVSAGTMADAVIGWTPSAFTDAFTNKASSAPSYQSASAAASAVLISNAISRAGGPHNMSTVITTMKSIHLDTFYGHLMFKPNGEAMVGMGRGMVTVQNQADGTSLAVAPAAQKEVEASYPATTCDQTVGAARAAGMSLSLVVGGAAWLLRAAVAQ